MNFLFFIPFFLLYTAFGHAQSRHQRFAEKTLALGDSVGLTFQELEILSQFINEKLPQYIEQGTHYLKKEISGLPRTIEYDPATNRIFIHLKRHGIQKLGSGGFKTVTKSILYDQRSPIIVANCVTSSREELEAELFRKLKGKPGIPKIYAVTAHTQVNGRKRLSILMKLYRPGSLNRVFSSHKYRFSLKEKVRIALGIAKGLETLHRHNFVHRDVKPGNVLISIPHGRKSRVVDAVITDFGSVYDKNERDDTPSLAHATYIFTPPEGLAPRGIDMKKLKTLDYYPLGCTLYELFYGRFPPWLRSNKVALLAKKIRREFPDKEDRYKGVLLLHNNIAKYIGGKLKKLEATKRLSAKKDFERVILRLLSSKQESPAFRNMTALRKKFQRLLKTIRHSR
jgi:serine/threonine protein kinase